MKSIRALWILGILAPTLLAAGASDGADVQEVHEANRRYTEALVRGDVGELDRLLHRAFTHTTHDGLQRGKSELLDLARSQTAVRRTVRGEDARFEKYGDTVVVTQRLDAPAGAGGAVESVRATLVWVKDAELWRLVAEQRSAPFVRAAASEPRTAAAKTTTASPGAQASARAVSAAQRENGSEASVAADPLLAVSSAGKDADSRQRSGLLPEKVRRLIRAYEPNQVGYTFDDEDDSYLDFTFSLMLPLVGSDYPDAFRQTNGARAFRPFRFGSPGLYFAHTQRAGQYIGTRSSSPVVGKRFNPLLAFRFWGVDADGDKESEDNFLEFIYGHESNGQFLSSAESFAAQYGVYYGESTQSDDPQARAEARRSTRDNISRGWDYVGAQFARDWDMGWVIPWDKTSMTTVGLRAKASYYLSRGLAQGPREQYNAWENDPEGKARKYVDGLSMRVFMTIGHGRESLKAFGLERRYALTWTTGYADPLRYNTVKVEAGVMAFGLPLMLWYRTGYNSDLIDYYRRDQSYGATLSFWKY